MTAYTNSVCIAHEPCPRCHSRDNLSVWSDGHKFCFGCRYFVPGNTTEKQHEEILASYNTTRTTIVDVLKTGSKELNIKAVRWIQLYDMDPDEMVYNYGFLWSDRYGLIMPAGDSLDCISIRTFNPESPKYLTFGNRDLVQPYTTQSTVPFKRGLLICTEDVLSAIKVHLAGYNSIPCLGTDVPARASKWAVEHSKDLGIWLDWDMVQKSLRTALMVQVKEPALTGRVRSIISSLDPKLHTPAEISLRIRNVFEYIRPTNE